MVRAHSGFQKDLAMFKGGNPRALTRLFKSRSLLEKEPRSSDGAFIHQDFHVSRDMNAVCKQLLVTERCLDGQPAMKIFDDTSEDVMNMKRC